MNRRRIVTERSSLCRAIPPCAFGRFRPLGQHGFHYRRNSRRLKPRHNRRPTFPSFVPEWRRLAIASRPPRQPVGEMQPRAPLSRKQRRPYLKRTRGRSENPRDAAQHHFGLFVVRPIVEEVIPQGVKVLLYRGALIWKPVGEPGDFELSSQNDLDILRKGSGRDQLAEPRQEVLVIAHRPDRGHRLEAVVGEIVSGELSQPLRPERLNVRASNAACARLVERVRFVTSEYVVQTLNRFREHRASSALSARPLHHTRRAAAATRIRAQRGRSGRRYTPARSAEV